jgi:cell wall-associated NlpC family hydrolase
LLREVFKNELGIDLGEDNLIVVEDSWGSTIQGTKPEWIEVTTPEPYDVVLMFNRRGAEVPEHLGVYAGNGRVLHTRRRTGSIVEPLEALQRAGIVEGFYRHKGV